MKAKLKQLISSLLVAALLLQMAPFEALAADSAATADPPVVSSEPDESIVVGGQGQLDHLPLGTERLAGAGHTQIEAVAVEQLPAVGED